MGGLAIDTKDGLHLRGYHQRLRSLQTKRCDRHQ